MMRKHNLTSANVILMLGIFLLFLSLLFFAYWWINKPPLVEYTFSSEEIQLVVPEEEKDWEIKISKIDVSAPIIMNIDGNNEIEYLRSLQRGVAHLKGTKIPGQKGNVFIFGHSSYLFYDPGDYKTVFRKLDELEADDEIIIKSNLEEYKYKVVEKKVINPDEVEVTGEIFPGEETLTLMTCTPPGTTFKRLVVIAERI